MSDVRDAPQPANEQGGKSPHGHLVWYELMTPDAQASKAFYDKVVGWNFGDPVEEYQGYRMIGRSDGGFAGGVLTLTDEMKQHGARTTWRASTRTTSRARHSLGRSPSAPTSRETPTIRRRSSSASRGASGARRDSTWTS